MNTYETRVSIKIERLANFDEDVFVSNKQDFKVLFNIIQRQNQTIQCTILAHAESLAFLIESDEVSTDDEDISISSRVSFPAVKFFARVCGLKIVNCIFCASDL